MMQDMAAKGLAAKEAEKIQHTEYMKWCVDTTRTKKCAHFNFARSGVGPRPWRVCE